MGNGRGLGSPIKVSHRGLREDLHNDPLKLAPRARGLCGNSHSLARPGRCASGA
ncbi:MAG: hypothetical protein Tsb0032_16650 [Kiloniellaceae bacterium]